MAENNCSMQELYLEWTGRIGCISNLSTPDQPGQSLTAISKNKKPHHT